jgi:hypothetical protein
VRKAKIEEKAKNKLEYNKKERERVVNNAIKEEEEEKKAEIVEKIEELQNQLIEISNDNLQKFTDNNDDTGAHPEDEQPVPKREEKIPIDELNKARDIVLNTTNEVYILTKEEADNRDSIESFINKHKKDNRIIMINDSVIWISPALQEKEVLNLAVKNKALDTKINGGYKTKRGTYSLHIITDFNDIPGLVERIKEIWRVENKKRIVKMSSAFGTILETVEKGTDGKDKVSHSPSPPSFEKSVVLNGPPMTVNNPEALNIFAELVLAQLRELMEKCEKDTKTKIVCVYSLMIACYHILPTGKATLGQDWVYAICMFGALTYLLYPQKMSHNMRNSKAIKLFLRYMGYPNESPISKIA